MDALSVLKSYYMTINKNFSYYKNNFAHTYYLNVNDEETFFIDKMFKNMDNVLSSQDKMLNYSVSTIYTATAVLLQMMDRYGIQYDNEQIENLCKGFSVMAKDDTAFNEMSDDDLEEVLFGLLTDRVDLESRKKSGSERTPNEIIEYMLDLIDYKGKDIVNATIVDPACGTGTFISQITNRYVDSLEIVDDSNTIKEKFLNDKVIRAYDTKPSNVYITKIVLLTVLIRRKIISNMTDIIELMQNLPIYCEDFLQVTEKVDYVIGNPPYIRLQNLACEYREFIKRNFASATGRFDIYTCFIENADRILKDDGKLCLITSNKYLTANYGVGIRSYLAEGGHVKKIIDLYDTKFFGAAVLPAIIVCENRKSNADIQYIGIKNSAQKGQYNCNNATELFNYIEKEMKDNRSTVKYGTEKDVSFEIVRSKIRIPTGGKTWNFSASRENDIKVILEERQYCTLGDILDVCVGIKTTADTVFVKPMTEKFIADRKLEKEVIYPLIQSFDVDKWKITWGTSSKDRYILYPHKEKRGNMEAIPLEEVPHAKRYLEECEETLKKRTYLAESKTREWYECWVPQKLSKFQQPKIVTRDIVSHNSFAYDDSGKLCQGNTFFLTKKKSVFGIEYSTMSEEEYYFFVLGMLNSKVMEYYQKMISGCLYSQKYRYTTSNLNRWPIPNIKIDQAMQISNLVKCLLRGEKERVLVEKDIDNIMYEQFKLNDKDIDKIEQFILISA